MKLCFSVYIMSLNYVFSTYRVTGMKLFCSRSSQWEPYCTCRLRYNKRLDLHVKWKIILELFLFLYKIQKIRKIRLIKPSKWGMKNWMIFISLGLCGLGCCSSAVCTKRASETCCINLFLLCFGLFILSFESSEWSSVWGLVGVLSEGFFPVDPSVSAPHTCVVVARCNQRWIFWKPQFMIAAIAQVSADGTVSRFISKK